MEGQLHDFRDRADPSPSGQAGWRASLILFFVALVICGVSVLAAELQNFDLSSLLLGTALPTMGAVLFFLARFLLQASDRELRSAHALLATENSLVESEERFRQMADNIQEIFWMLDAVSREALYVNPAFEIITGRPRTLLRDHPLAYEEIIHPDDRAAVLEKLAAATRTGSFEEQFRILVPSGQLRWVWARGFPVFDERGKIARLVGTALDITGQKLAQQAVIRNLELAESARSEADAMRKATLALTEDLRMDRVLDTLLRSLLDLVPYESAQILLLESDSRLFVAREASSPKGPKPSAHYPITLDTGKFPILQRVLASGNAVSSPDSSAENAWRPLTGNAPERSWLCVSLHASRQTLGLLCMQHSIPGVFTRDHLRLAELLAIPASAAIQNARLYECARIYGAELERRTSDLREMEDALQRFHPGRPL
jgi:PAS domain S-box-containing protein